MAVTPVGGFGTADALTVKHWSASLYQQALMDMYFGKYIGKSADSLIENKFDLTKQKGDQVTFGLLMKMSGAGRVGDASMEGNEESLAYFNYAQKIYLRKNAVLAAGKFSMRMTETDFRRDAKMGLSGWLKEIMEQDIIYALSGLANTAATVAVNAPSTNRVWKGGQTSAGVVEHVTTDALIDSATNNLFGAAVISVIKRKAQLASPKIRPIKVDGKEYYIIFVHPNQAKALKADTDWKNAQLHAAERGSKNPIFSGMLGVIDGVVVQEHDGIITKTGDGEDGTYFESGDPINTTLTVARALFCGAQAGIIGWGQQPSWSEKMFDYGDVPGIKTDVIYGVGKPEFDSEDFGVIAVDTLSVPDA